MRKRQAKRSGRPKNASRQVRGSGRHCRSPRHAAGGERSKAQLSAGKSYFRKAGVEHDVLNETATEIVFLEVELKP
jgi:beta-alanine degradation protein BauB